MQDSTRVQPERPDSFRQIDDSDIMDESDLEEVDRAYRLQIRRGMARGAAAGFVLGLMPLTMMTILGAFAGTMITRASRLRIERVSGPRIQFVRRTNHLTPR